MAVALAALMIIQPGCISRDPSGVIPADRFNFNEAVVTSWNEQLLLNLVRLRYQDTLMFLDVGSVVTQYSLTQNANAGTSIPLTRSLDMDLGLGGSISYGIRPTITYTPLQGEEFAERLLSPISPLTLMLLSQSGWSLKLLLLLCVQEINTIKNAPSAAGPTPRFRPAFERFQRLAELLRELQLEHLVELRLLEDQDVQIMQIVVSMPEAGQSGRAAVEELMDLLGHVAQPGQRIFRVTGAVMQTNPDDLAITSRSLLGVLFFLAHAVEGPEKHLREGRIPTTLTSAGERFDWSRVTGDLLRIRSQVTRPDRAFAAVRYRDHWFYIDDADPDSKATMGLLTYLFSLQSAGTAVHRPILTLPASHE